VGVAVLAACGDGTSTSTLATTTTSTPTTTSEATTSTQPPTTVTTAVITTTTIGDSNDLAEGSGCTPGEGPLPDGQWFGYVTSRSEDSLDFDLACWFTGAGAIQASAEDGEESPPPNDYYVRNVSIETRAVAVGEVVEVVFFPDGDPGNMLEVDYDDWAEMVAGRGFELGVWLEIEDGAITEIHEQWVP
jgi:hypothetical protein